MQTARSATIVFQLFCLVALYACGQSSTAEDFLLDSQVRWSTAEQPEIHLLIENRSGSSEDFTVDWNAGLKCKDSRYLEWARSERPSGWKLPTDYISATRGAIPPGRWAHRVYLFGGGTIAVGCEVLVRVTRNSDSSQLGQKWILVESEDYSRNSSGEISTAELRIESFVERDVDKRGLLVRLLLRNQSSRAAWIGIEEEGIHCNGRSKGRMNYLARDPPQPLARGPLYAHSQKWVVFILPVYVEQDSFARGADCMLNTKIQIVGENSASPIYLSKDVSLIPEGYVELP